VTACYRDVEARGEPRPEEAERILRDRLRASRLRDRDEVVIVHGGPSAEQRGDARRVLDYAR
jgi:hypothetical protein